MSSPGEPAPRPVLVVAAHPDDETVGAGVAISRLRNTHILHVTDGAPRDPRFVSKLFSGSTEEYARARRDELEAAMRLASVPPHRIRSLGLNDQESSLAMAAASRRLAAEIARLQPRTVITHAYEGGHPDHDATAFAVHAAAELLRRRGARSPRLVEMALYHGERGHFVGSEFVQSTRAHRAVRLHLKGEELELKQRMFACFATQQPVLSQFPVTVEVFRRAPRYQFTSPPHEGQTWYELQGWPLSATRWRELAAGALAELGVEHDAWL